MERKRIFHFCIIILMMISGAFVTNSCTDDEDINLNPVITSVNDIVNNLPVTQGYRENMYIIHGARLDNTTEVYFNGVLAQYNPALSTYSNVFVIIPEDAPYGIDDQEIKLVTTTGSTTYEFTIAPPAPSFKSFQPVNAADGEQITIYGNYFVNPVVTVGGIEATIVSYTETQIVATLPAGSQDKKVMVTTSAGSTEWGTAVGTAIYDDAFYAPWNISSWNGHEYVTDFDGAFQGSVYIKKTIPAWGNLQSDWIYDTVPITKYKGIKFAVRSDSPGKVVFLFNGQYWGDATRAINTSKEWTEYEYTWADLGNPSVVQFIGFQEFSGSENNYYFDNFSYITE
ncbi:MAG: IPT/TIG domain-containing protein [Bergeyella sp.]